MQDVTEESMKEFIERLNECGTALGEGKIAVDLNRLCMLVHENRETAAHIIEHFCMMAQGNPAYFQGALSIASAYQIEFQDVSFVDMVRAQAKAAGAEEWLERIGVLE